MNKWIVEFGKRHFNDPLKVADVKQQLNVSGSSSIVCVTTQRRGRKRQSHLLFWTPGHMIFVASPITAYLDPFPRVIPWRAQLIGGQRGRGEKKGALVREWHQILWFWWVSWPQSSLIIHQNPRTKIIWRRLCFYHNMWHRDNNKTLRQPQFRCAMRSWMGHAYLSLSWMEESRIFSWICLPSDSFVPPPPPRPLPGRIFSQDSCGCVWGGGLRDKKKKKRRERKAHWSQRHRITIQSQAVTPLGLRSLQRWLLGC